MRIRLKAPLSLPARWATPCVLRPSFTLGGAGGGIAYDEQELREIVAQGLELSPAGEVLVEESIIGWKEYEMEVMRDKAGNGIIVCSIENVDAMGVHTGDSITVAPAQTLSDVEYQRMAWPRSRFWRKSASKRAARTSSSRSTRKKRPPDRHRNEPAREPLIGARVEGDRFPHRESCCAPGRGLHAR